MTTTTTTTKGSWNSTKTTTIAAGNLTITSHVTCTYVKVPANTHSGFAFRQVCN
jgi:hypothetical protein